MLRLLKFTIDGDVSFSFNIFVKEFFNASAETELTNKPKDKLKTTKYLFIGFPPF